MKKLKFQKKHLLAIAGLLVVVAAGLVFNAFAYYKPFLPLNQRVNDRDSYYINFGSLPNEHIAHRDKAIDFDDGESCDQSSGCTEWMTKLTKDGASMYASFQNASMLGVEWLVRDTGYAEVGRVIISSCSGGHANFSQEFNLNDGISGFPGLERQLITLPSNCRTGDIEVKIPKKKSNGSNNGGGTYGWVRSFSAWSAAPAVDISVNGVGGTVDFAPPANYTVYWSTSGAEFCTASGSWSGNKNYYGGSEYKGGVGAGYYTYTITCTNPVGSASKSVNVRVYTPPSVDLKIGGRDDANWLAPGADPTLTWSSSNASSCTASGSWSGGKALSGSETQWNLAGGNRYNTYTYSLTCYGAYGSARSDTVYAYVYNPTSVNSKVYWNGASRDLSSLTITKGDAVLFQNWTDSNAYYCYTDGLPTDYSYYNPTNSYSMPMQFGYYYPTSNATYAFYCRNELGYYVSDSVAITAVDAPTADVKVAGQDGNLTFTAPASFTANWSGSPGCTSGGRFSGSGTSGSRTETNLGVGTYTYSTTCTNAAGRSTSDSVTVTVVSAPTADINIFVGGVNRGKSLDVTFPASYELRWTSTNATSCSGSGSLSASTTSGTDPETASGAGTFTYTVTCRNAAGTTASSTAMVRAHAAPTADLYIRAGGVNRGNSYSITAPADYDLVWTSSNASACTGSGSLAGASGTSRTVNKTGITAGTYTYTITCTNPAGATAVDTATATVVAAPTADVNISVGGVNKGNSHNATAPAAFDVVWSSANASSCTGSGGLASSSGTSGTVTKTGVAAGTYTYTLTCQNSLGATASDTATVNVYAAPTADIYISVSGVNQGDSYSAPPPAAYDVIWSSTNGTSCTGSADLAGSNGTSGTVSKTGIPSGTYTYTITCQNAAGTTAVDTATVDVYAAPTVDLYIRAGGVNRGNTYSLTAPAAYDLVWSSTNATSCTGSGALAGSSGLSGTVNKSGVAAGTYTYTITCQNAGGTTAMDTATVSVYAAPTVDLYIQVGGVNRGNSYSLTAPAAYNLVWTSANSVSCTGSGGLSGSNGLSGTVNFPGLSAGTYSYTITCQNALGAMSSDTATVSLYNSPTVDVSIIAGGVNKGNSHSATAPAAFDIAWTSTNASSCTGSGSLAGSNGASGTVNKTGTGAGTYTYTMTCQNGAGTTAVESVTVTVYAPPTIDLDFDAGGTNYDSTYVGAAPGAFNLVWNSTGATSCTGSGGLAGSNTLSGNVSKANLAEGAYSYTMTCQNAAGTSVSETISAAIYNQPTVTVSVDGSASNRTVDYGASYTISWDSAEALSCTGNAEVMKHVASVGTSGSFTVSGNIPGTYAYAITCQNELGAAESDVDSRTVTVSDSLDVDLKIGTDSSPSQIFAAPASFTVTGIVNGYADEGCTVTGGLTGSPASGYTRAETGRPAGTYSYTLSCSNSYGKSDSDSLTVTVYNRPTVTVRINNNAFTYNGSVDTPYTVSWTTTNALACTGNAEVMKHVASVGTSGSFTVSTPELGSFTYSITCTNQLGAGYAQTGSRTANIYALPTVDLKIGGSDGPFNFDAPASYTVSGAVGGYVTTCSQTGGLVGSPGIGYSKTEANLPGGTYAYTLTCSNNLGRSASDSLTVTVIDLPPEVDLKVNGEDGPLFLTSNPASYTLSWNNTHVSTASCQAWTEPALPAWDGTITPSWSGSQALSNVPWGSYTHYLRCTNTGGSDTDSVEVTVGEPLTGMIFSDYTGLVYKGPRFPIPYGPLPCQRLYGEIGGGVPPYTVEIYVYSQERGDDPVTLRPYKTISNTYASEWDTAPSGACPATEPLFGVDYQGEWAAWAVITDALNNVFKTSDFGSGQGFLPEWVVGLFGIYDTP